VRVDGKERQLGHVTEHFITGAGSPSTNVSGIIALFHQVF
jgi:hypothetical protein